MPRWFTQGGTTAAIREDALKFYNMKAGMNPRRVRIFLAEKNLAIPTVEIDMMKGENATPDFLQSIRSASCRCSNWTTAAS